MTTFIVECTRHAPDPDAILKSKTILVTRYLKEYRQFVHEDGVNGVSIITTSVEKSLEFNTWIEAKRAANGVQVLSHWNTEVCEVGDPE